MFGGKKAVSAANPQRRSGPDGDEGEENPQVRALMARLQMLEAQLSQHAEPKMQQHPRQQPRQQPEQQAYERSWQQKPTLPQRPPKPQKQPVQHQPVTGFDVVRGSAGTDGSKAVRLADLGAKTLGEIKTEPLGDADVETDGSKPVGLAARGDSSYF